MDERKAVEIKRKRAPLIKRATLMAEKKCQACFKNKPSCSGEPFAFEERYVRRETWKLYGFLETARRK